MEIVDRPVDTGLDVEGEVVKRILDLVNGSGHPKKCRNSETGDQSTVLDHVEYVQDIGPVTPKELGGTFDLVPLMLGQMDVMRHIEIGRTVVALTRSGVLTTFTQEVQLEFVLDDPAWVPSGGILGKDNEETRDRVLVELVVLDEDGLDTTLDKRVGRGPAAASGSYSAASPASVAVALRS